MGYNTLSIGCGAGIFEILLLNKLLSQKKTIHFVGIEPNKEEYFAIQQKLNGLERQTQKFFFEIFNEDFDSFSSDRTFATIWCIHSLYYFRDLESTFLKIGSLLEPDGEILIVSEPLQALSIPYLCMASQLWETSPWYSQDIEEVLDRCQIPFYKQGIPASFDISDCFNFSSKRRKQLLDFIIGFNTDYFSVSQKQMFLHYLREISQVDPDGKIICPFSSDIFYVSKWN